MKSCKTCKFWDKNLTLSSGLDRHKEQGSCLKIGEQRQSSDARAVVIGITYTELVTTEDFGCILHEE